MKTELEMKIELSYVYSNLDKRQEFGLVTQGYNETYIRWIWYYLGVFLGDNYKFKLYPFSMASTMWKGRVLKSYKYHTHAKKQALLIANKINRYASEYSNV